MTETEEPLVLRRVERKVGEGWETITFDKLRKGDLFKLYDDGYTHISGPSFIEHGDHVYVANDDATPCEPSGNYVVDCDYAEDKEER